MPLNTQITRDGKALKISWSEFHVAAMTYASAIDSKEGKLYEAMVEHDEVPDTSEPLSLPPGVVFQTVMYHVIAATPLNDGPYTLKSEFSFHDPTDGEVFVLKAGDILSASRGW